MKVSERGMVYANLLKGRLFSPLGPQREQGPRDKKVREIMAKNVSFFRTVIPTLLASPWVFAVCF